MSEKTFYKFTEFLMISKTFTYICTYLTIQNNTKTFKILYITKQFDTEAVTSVKLE